MYSCEWVFPMNIIPHICHIKKKKFRFVFLLFQSLETKYQFHLGFYFQLLNGSC